MTWVLLTPSLIACRTMPGHILKSGEEGVNYFFCLTKKPSMSKQYLAPAVLTAKRKGKEVRGQAATTSSHQ